MPGQTYLVRVVQPDPDLGIEDAFTLHYPTLEPTTVVQWDEVEGVEGYEVHLLDDQGAERMVRADAAATSASIYGTGHAFVLAVNAHGKSAASNVIAITEGSP